MLSISRPRGSPFSPRMSDHSGQHGADPAVGKNRDARPNSVSPQRARRLGFLVMRTSPRLRSPGA